MSPGRRKVTLRPRWKLWLELNGSYVFGPGAYAILKSIKEAGSISGGAKALNMSYRYAWGVIHEIESKIGEKLIITRKGGQHGGGAEVTQLGTQLMETYARLNNEFKRIAKDVHGDL